MPNEYDGMPFQYNPSITNVNIDNQLAGILSQFDDEYIIDTVEDSLKDRLRLYNTPRPNVVAAFETTFKYLTDGYSSNTGTILETRNNVYQNIIHTICNFYDLDIRLTDDTDLYSAAYWLYDFLVSNFTENLKNFYVFYLLREKDGIESALGLSQVRKDNDVTLAYSKKIFRDPKIAAIHCNLEYVIDQISTFNIDLWTILNCVYMNNASVPNFIYSIIADRGNFFKNHYESYVLNSRDSADILTYIKLSLQEMGRDIEAI